MENFKEALEGCFEEFLKVVESEKGDWTVKGFIDIYKNIYTISVDTKVVSKIVELMVFPIVAKFASDNNLKMDLSVHQNHYPDLTFINQETGEKIALDLKSTYRLSPTKVNGMTLGAFTGYFRTRTSTKNIRYPYQDYSKHYVLGVLYSKSDLAKAEGVLKGMEYKMNNKKRDLISKYLSSQDDGDLSALLKSLGINEVEQEDEAKKVSDALNECIIDERVKHTIDDLQNIVSVVRSFKFFVQEKWKIANDRPGSGNTKNIGSTVYIDELVNGKGKFTKYKDGHQMFDDYWMYYMTKDMAKAHDLEAPPYRNLQTYFEYKNIEPEKIEEAKAKSEKKE